MIFTLEQLLDFMEIRHLPKSGRLQLCCPFHHDTDPSAGFYEDTNLFHCFACDLTMNPYAFYAKFREIPYAEAKEALEAEFGEIPRPKRGEKGVLLRERVYGERRLSIKAFDFKIHAELGELLDKILFAYERGQIDEGKLARAMVSWGVKVSAQETDK